MREQVNLIYKRGQLVFNFVGNIEYDPIYVGRYHSGWTFKGSYFSASLWGKKAMELRKEENQFLTWNYDIPTEETPENFFINLLNGLGKRNI